MRHFCSIIGTAQFKRACRYTLEFSTAKGRTILRDQTGSLTGAVRQSLSPPVSSLGDALQTIVLTRTFDHLPGRLKQEPALHSWCDFANSLYLPPNSLVRKQIPTDVAYAFIRLYLSISHCQQVGNSRIKTPDKSPETALYNLLTGRQKVISLLAPYLCISDIGLIRKKLPL